MRCRLQSAFAKNISELKLDVPADLTISIGIAIYPQDGITFRAFLKSR